MQLLIVKKINREEEAESKEVQRDLASLFRYPCFFFIRVKKQARQSLGVENHKPRNAAHLDLCLRVTLCTSLILKVCQGILAKYEAANALLCANGRRRQRGQMFSSSKVKRQRNSLQVGLFLSWDNPKEREGCREVWSKIFDVNVKC